MWEELAELLERIDAPVSGLEIRRAIALHERLAVRIIEGVGEWDHCEEWKSDGYLTPVAWLTQRARLSRRDAAELVGRARDLRAFPAVAQAARTRELTLGQLTAIRANITDLTRPVFAKHVDELLPDLLPLTARDVSMVMRTWQSYALDEIDAVTVAPEAVRRLHISQTAGGVWYVNGVLDEAAGVVVARAIDAAITADTDGEPERDPARRRADALVAIAELTLAESDPAVTGRNRAHIDLVIDVADLLTGDPKHARTVDGHRLDPVSAMQLACDPVIHRVLRAGSVILDYGRGERLFNDRQRRVLELRDGGCRWPGCDRTVRWCQAHHVVDWVKGGPTDIANGVLLCTRHHRFLHTPGYRIDIDANAVITITGPYGTHTSTPRPPPRPPGTLTT